MFRLARVGDKDNKGNTIVEGSPNMKDQGFPIARVGDKLSDGSVITTGNPTIMVDGKPAAIVGSQVSNGNSIVGPCSGKVTTGFDCGGFSASSLTNERLTAAGLQNAFGDGLLTPEEIVKLFTKDEAKEKNKVILIFYHGGPFGEGQIKKSNEDVGHTGKIYDQVYKYAISKGREVVGAIIAPAFTQGAGVSRGADFLLSNYKLGNEVIIYGYSYGGDNAVNLAEFAEDESIPIDTMVIVDSSDGPARSLTVDSSVPSNVAYTLNLYQTKSSGTSSRSGKDSDDPKSSEKSSTDGSSNLPGSRGYRHSAEGTNRVDNIDGTAPDVTHGNIQQKKESFILSTIKSRIDAYKSSQ
ncbi:PAAR domain-containing protein [Zooshikella sp. RANM57]|uniref:PAAR domain-containing protein n=1 Tax=Zooshikella sp. RANM57 TaxID=3425863 RepID=UPI003D6F2430